MAAKEVVNGSREEGKHLEIESERPHLPNNAVDRTAAAKVKVEEEEEEAAEEEEAQALHHQSIDRPTTTVYAIFLA